MESNSKKCNFGKGRKNEQTSKDRTNCKQKQINSKRCRRDFITNQKECCKTIQRIVIDTNIIISALIKDSINRKIILNFKGKIYCPIIIFVEIFRYKDLIIQKSKLDASEVENLIHLLFNKIKFIDNQSLLKHKHLAKDICKDIDINDEMFFACAIHCDCPIWSNDKVLKIQNKIKILSTEEIMRLLNWTS